MKSNSILYLRKSVLDSGFSNDASSEKPDRSIRYIIYPMVFMSAFGEAILSFSVAGFQLSLFRVLVLLSFVAFIFRAEKAIIIPRTRSRYSIVFYIAWLMYAIVSFLWALNALAWIKAVFFIATGLMISLAANSYLINERLIRGALIALLLGFAIQSVIGWYEVSTRTLVIGSLDRIDYLQNRRVFYPYALTGNPNSLAMMMMFASCISLYLIKKSTNRWQKLILILLAFECTALILQTTSRGAFMGLLISMASFLLLSKQRALLVVTASFIILFLSPLMLDFAGHYFSFNLSGTGSDATRWNLMLNGFYLLGNSLGIGVGAGQIEYNMAIYAIYPTFGMVNIHNWWLEILVGYGIPIFIGYVLFYGRMLMDLISSYRKGVHLGERCDFAVFGISVMMGFTIASISASSNMSCEWLWVFWAVMIAWQGNCSALNEREDNITA